MLQAVIKIGSDGAIKIAQSSVASIGEHSSLKKDGRLYSMPYIHGDNAWQPRLNASSWSPGLSGVVPMPSTIARAT